MNRILIDTDVLLDFFFDREPFSDNAAKVLSLCENKVIKGYITPVMISNMYYILRKTEKHDKVIENIKKLLEFIDIAQMNKKSILEALHSHFNDFEDALQNYSAENEGINTIITRNIKNYKTSNLIVITPEKFLKAANFS